MVGPDDIFRVMISYGPVDEIRVENKPIYEGTVEGALKAFEKKRKDRIRHGYIQVD